MLPHYSPLKVAETLQRARPGCSRAGSTSASAAPPGTDPLTTFALQRDRRQAAPDDFPEQLAELLALPRGHAAARPSRSRGSPTLPGRPEAPEPWLLGSSPQSAIWAGGARPALRVRRLHQPERRRRSPSSTGRRFAPSRRARRARSWPSRVWALVRRHRRGGRAARGERADGVHAAAPGPADPGAAGREGASASSAAARSGTAAPAPGAARSLGTPRAACAPGSRRSRASTAPRR